MSRWRWASGIAGVVAAGAAAGLTAERLTVGQARRRPDPEAREQFGELPGRSSQVRTEDGIALHVEESGDPDAPVTLVFVHGFTNTMAVWYYQRRDLADLGRLVFYDQRSHGKSERAPAQLCTIEQLGRDLFAVLEACAPTGPVVLVGHSLGGMTVMALAEQCPEIFGDRVIAVALLGTSGGRMREVTFGLPALINRMARLMVPVITRPRLAQLNLVELGRRTGTDLSFLLTRRFSFGSPDVSPALVDLIEGMVGSTPFDVIAAFYPSMMEHDRMAALAALSDVTVLVLVGDADLICPIEHSREIADALPHGDFVTVAGAGHMVVLERAPLVNLHLRTLLRRALEEHCTDAH